MTCWSPWCPSVTMSKLDPRVCHIHAIRFVIRGEPLPLSIVPLQELARKMLMRQHPSRAGHYWGYGEIAEELGVSKKHIDRLMTGDCAPVLRLGNAETWADRFKLHPFDIWGDAYFARVNQRLAA